jgi:hypothetical protein
MSPGPQGRYISRVTSTLQRLQDWYRSQCDGDWEHTYGVEIGTLDNPGWSVKIDLTDTALESAAFATYEDQYDHDLEWLRCWTQDRQFHAACGPNRLEDALTVFLVWAERAASGR